MPGFDDDDPFGLAFDAPPKKKPRAARTAPPEVDQSAVQPSTDVEDETTGDPFGLDFDAEPVSTREDVAPSPMGPPAPTRELRQPTEPSIWDELTHSYNSFWQGVYGNTLDELAPHMGFPEKAEEFRQAARDYPLAHGAGQAAQGVAASVAVPGSVAAQALTQGALGAANQYADTHSGTDATIAGLRSGVLSGALTHFGNLVGNTFAKPTLQGIAPTVDDLKAAYLARGKELPEAAQVPLSELPPDAVRAAMRQQADEAAAAAQPPPMTPPGPAQDPFHGRAGELARTPPEAIPPPPDVPAGPAQDPFAGRAGEIARTPPEPVPPNVPGGPAQDPFQGRLGEIARTPPEAPPSLGPSGPVVDPFQGRAGDLARMPAEKPVMDELIGAPKAVTPAAPQKLGPHTWPASLSPQEQQIAETIRQVLPQVARENNGRVFVGRLLDAFPDELRAPVKAALPKLQQTGALKMSRADLVQAFDPDMVARSSVRRGPAPKAGAIDQRPEFHFIDPEALGIKPPPANDLEGLLRQSVEQVQAKGKPSPAGSPAVGARPQPGLELAETPPPAASRKWQPMPEDVPLETEAIPSRQRPTWMEPTPETPLELAETPAARARAPWQPPVSEAAPLELAENVPPMLRREWQPPPNDAPLDLAFEPTRATPAAEPPPYLSGRFIESVQRDAQNQLAKLPNPQANPTGATGRNVLDVLGIAAGRGLKGRMVRAGINMIQPSERELAIQSGKLVPNQTVKNIAYAGAPTLNYAIQAALSDDRNGLSPEDRQKLTSAVVSGDQKQTNAVDWLLSQTNPAYAKLREQKLRDTAEEE